MATSWFKYNGGAIEDTNSYSAVSLPLNCPIPKQQVCAIFSETQIVNNVSRPVITSELQSQITTALSTMTESANVKLQP